MTSDGVATLEKKNTDKYRAIIEAAIQVFGEHGYHNARVVKIARAAGVAEGTVYLYFRNKQDLLVSAFREKMDVFTSAVERELLGGGGVPASVKLRRLVELHFNRLGGDYTLALFFQIHLRQPDDTIRSAISGPLARYARVIDAVVDEGTASGEFLTGLNKKLARQIIFGAMDEVVSNWVRAQGKYSLPEQAAPVFAFLLRGLTGKH